MKYKLITFDFTNTLMRFSIAPVVQYEKVASLYGISIKDRRAFQTNFLKAFEAISCEHPNFGASTQLHWTQWWLRVVKNTFTNAGVRDSPALENIGWHLIKLYSTRQGWEVIPGVENLLRKLSQRGQRMGVISNFDPRLSGILQEAGLRHYFEFVLPSYEVSTCKPHPDIFKIALEKYSKEPTAPHECCHVGDTYSKDYVGAINSGWKAILVNESPNSVSKSEWCKTIQEVDDRSLLIDN